MKKVDRKMRTFSDIVFERLLLDLGSILASILGAFLNIFAPARFGACPGRSGQCSGRSETRPGGPRRDFGLNFVVFERIV